MVLLTMKRFQLSTAIWAEQYAPPPKKKVLASCFVIMKNVFDGNSREVLDLHLSSHHT